MSIWKLLGLGSDATEAEATAETETVRKIVRRLDGMDPAEATRLATFAGILSRVARADMTISDDETQSMERIVEKIGGLPPEQAIIVVQIAKTQNLLLGGTENYLLTREFNRIADRKAKLDLLHCLFAVSASDDGISTAEDNVIRQIADELLLEHADYISVRSTFRDRLSVLKGDG